MKKNIIILIIMLLTLSLFGCNSNNAKDSDYIDIKKKYNESKEVIDLVVANMDVKLISEYLNLECPSNKIYFESKFSLSYFEEIDGVRIKFERIMIRRSFYDTVIMYEMKNEERAKEACKEYKEKNPNNDIFYEKNIVYFDEVIFNLMMKNYYVEDNNYITLDGKFFLTNLSKNEVLYIPNVIEIARQACVYNTNIKSLYTNESLEKINYGAFNGCLNLENVFLNKGLKEIGEVSFIGCDSLKYVVIPESVEKIGAEAFSHGIIYCEALEKPKGWDDNFAYHKAKVRWGNEWEYNEEGIPVLK